jgi:hypothetical protein
MTDRFAYCLDLMNLGITQFTDFSYNSFGKIGNQYLAANENGLWILGANTDDGEYIDCYFDLVIDFQVVTHVRSLYIGCETSGRFKLTVVFDDRTAEQQTYTITPVLSSNYQHGEKIYLGSSNRGRYMRLIFENVDGSDIGIDTIDAEIINTGKRYL